MSEKSPARIKVGNRWIGAREPCYVIAEAGSNHNGHLGQALALIDVASEAGRGTTFTIWIPTVQSRTASGFPSTPISARRALTR